MPKKLNPNRQAAFDLAEKAQQDIREIWSYLAEKSPVSADKLITELFVKFQLLAKNAELGRSRNEFLLNLRSFPVKKYIVFYIPTEMGIEIFRIIHSSRNIAGIFDDFFSDLES